LASAPNSAVPLFFRAGKERGLTKEPTAARFKKAGRFQIKRSPGIAFKKGGVQDSGAISKDATMANVVRPGPVLSP
jgi:hypothetical protein